MREIDLFRLSTSITKILAEVEDPAQSMLGILRTLGVHLDWQVAALWIVDDDKLLLRCSQFWQAPEISSDSEFEAVTFKRTFSMGEGLPGSAWLHRQIECWPDVQRSDNFPRASLAAKINLHRGLAVPLYVSSGVLGILELFRTNSEPVDGAVSEFLEALGGQIGVFLERARVKSRLQQLDTQMEALAETSRDAVLTIDSNSTILFANAATRQVLGYEPAELVGQKLPVLIPENLRARHLAGIHHYVETGQRRINWEDVCLPVLRKDGSLLPVEISFSEFTRDGQKVFTGFIRPSPAKKKDL